MSDLQFGLFFAAILVGYVLVHLRMVRFEEHLQKLAGIKSIDERLQGIDGRVTKLAEATAKVNLERISAQIERLHQDLEDLRERTTEVRQAVVKIPATPPVTRERSATPGRVAVSNESPATRIVALIETRLLQLGYRHIRLIGNLNGAQMADEIEVQVEAERNGMPFKGRVVMRNGSVHDVNVQSVAQSFP